MPLDPISLKKPHKPLLHLQPLIQIPTKNSINKYILFDQVANIQTYDLDAAVSIKYANNLTDLNNNWTIEEFPETETYSMNAALVSHWAARKTYDFFYTTFNRNGIDGNNKKTNIYVNYGGEIFGGNAKWSNTDEVIFIGSGVTSFSIHHFGVLDVIAHEFGHAVTYYSENDLEYSGESGAISEGISDIWGACVENYIGGQSDYAIWNHANQRGHSMRNMANPNAVPVGIIHNIRNLGLVCLYRITPHRAIASSNACIGT